MKIFLLYAFVIVCGELTMGNPHFPIHLYTFTKIPAWQWSLPVHLTGFFWILFMSKRLGSSLVYIPILLSLLFFLTGELLNAFLFHFFSYEQYPFGPVFSFVAVIFSYLVLCSLCCFLMKEQSLAAKSTDR